MACNLKVDFPERFIAREIDGTDSGLTQKVSRVTGGVEYSGSAAVCNDN
jgi:hypothetical protein